MFSELTSAHVHNPQLPRMARHLNTVCMLSTRQTDYLVHICRGTVTRVCRGPFVMPSYQFRIVAAEAEWQAFLQPLPQPGSHDLLALLRRGVLRFEGDLHPLMSHLLYFKLLLASLRPPAATP